MAHRLQDVRVRQDPDPLTAGGAASGEADLSDRAAFIAANCRRLKVPLVPEISLLLAHEALPLWQKTEEELGELGLPPPFWAFAWAGGQALARYVLDYPCRVRGRRVLDLACGSGLVAIAAKLAGAAHVLASDIDPFACAATQTNAAAMDTVLGITGHDLLAAPPPPVDTVLSGDIFYEKPLADRALSWLLQARSRGAEVLIGDPGRSYLPGEHLVRVLDYSVPVSRELEDAEIKHTTVWRLL